MTPARIAQQREINLATNLSRGDFYSNLFVPIHQQTGDDENSCQYCFYYVLLKSQRHKRQGPKSMLPLWLKFGRKRRFLSQQTNPTYFLRKLSNRCEKSNNSESKVRIINLIIIIELCVLQNIIITFFAEE